MKWTPDQQEAIAARNSNLLLAAAAGSGKTTVLVERILSLLEENANVDEVLVVTFTNAAASDMLEKLTEKLIERVDEKPQMREQLERLDRANISTIHSFCIDVLRNFFEAADVDPSFRIMDTPERKQMERQALKDAMQRRYQQVDDDLQALIFGRKAEKVGELALALYGFSLNRPDPKAFLQNSLALLEGDGTLWADELLHAARRKLRDALALFSAPLDLYARTGAPDFYLDLARADCAAVRDLLYLEYEPLRLMLGEVGFVRWKSPKAGTLPPEQEAAIARHQELRKAARDIVNGLKNGKPLKLLPMEEAILDLRASIPPLRALIDIVLLLDERMEELKNDRSAYGFSDLEHRALLALGDDRVAEALRARFSHVFVDEYQDVSDVQEAIIARLLRGDNLFMVGDVKQSIYRFRQAEPSLFIDKYERYGNGENGRLIALRQNFRSREGILHFANDVFERVMTGGDAEITYDEIARLRPGARYEQADPPIEVHLICEDDEQADPPPEQPAQDDEEMEELNDAEREGAVIVGRVRALLGTPYYDAKSGETRPLRYSDFVVLVRTRSVMPKLESMLKDADIPAYADMSESYFDVLEVRVMLSLLIIIENRRNDIELLAVLRSPIVDLSSNELAVVRAASREASYRDAMLAYMEKEENPLAERLRAFEGQLQRWRLLSLTLPLSQFVALLLRETRFYAYAGGLPAGQQRQANLSMMIALASDYEKTLSGGLSGFLQYMQDAPRGGDEFGTAHVLSAGDDVVRIMTVHTSKGLEFPVVLAAQMGRRLMMGKRSSSLDLHRELGVGLVLNDRQLGSARDTLCCRAIHERRALEDLNEEMRVLYVLITRAKHALILIGKAKKRGECLRDWSISARNPLRPKTWLDVIMPALLARMEEEPDPLMDCVPLKTEQYAAAIYWVGEASLARQAAADEAQKRSLVDLVDGVWAEAQQRPPQDSPLYWVYPHENEVLLPVKLTATGLTREITGPEALPQLTTRPRFLSEEGISAAERGSLTHAALQSLELARIHNLAGADLRAEIARQTAAMRAKGILFAPVEAGLLARFFEGETGHRLLAADRVEREWAFNLRLTAREAMVGDSDAQVLIQGVVDCCFLEDERWILLDYKTDRADDLDELILRYGPQVALYALAVERITGIPVAEKRIVLLRAGQEIVLSAEREL